MCKSLKRVSFFVLVIMLTISLGSIILFAHAEVSEKYNEFLTLKNEINSLSTDVYPEKNISPLKQFLLQYDSYNGATSDAQLSGAISLLNGMKTKILKTYEDEIASMKDISQNSISQDKYSEAQRKRLSDIISANSQAVTNENKVEIFNNIYGVFSSLRTYNQEFQVLLEDLNGKIEEVKVWNKASIEKMNKFIADYGDYNESTPSLKYIEANSEYKTLISSLEKLELVEVNIDVANQFLKNGSVLAINQKATAKTSDNELIELTITIGEYDAQLFETNQNIILSANLDGYTLKTGVSSEKTITLYIYSADKNALYDKVKECDTYLNSVEYLDLSALKTAVERAEIVLKNAAATAEDISGAIAGIESAINGLVCRTIVEIEAFPTYIKHNTELPKTISAKLNDNTTVELNVTYSFSGQFFPDRSGDYIIKTITINKLNYLVAENVVLTLTDFKITVGKNVNTVKNLIAYYSEEIDALNASQEKKTEVFNLFNAKLTQLDGVNTDAEIDAIQASVELAYSYFKNMLVSYTKPSDAAVEYDSELSLPTTIEVTLEDGSKVSLNVTYTGYNKAVAGEQTVTGTIAFGNYVGVQECASTFTVKITVKNKLVSYAKPSDAAVEYNSELPATIEVTLEDGSKVSLDVTYSGYDKTVVGEQTVTGTIALGNYEGAQGFANTFTVKVTVKNKLVSYAKPSDITLEYNSALSLPTTIEVTLQDGSKVSLNVTYTGYDKEVAGEQTVTGTIAFGNYEGAQGFENTFTVKVTVNKKSGCGSALDYTTLGIVIAIIMLGMVAVKKRKQN